MGKNFTLSWGCAACILTVAFSLHFNRGRAQAPVPAPVISAVTGLPSYPSTQFMAYGNGIYLACSGQTYSSSGDGLSWSQDTGSALPPQAISAVAFGAGLFVGVGAGGFISSSADGVNWTTRSAGVKDTLTDVEFLQGAFYAVGYNTRVLRSADGINWTTITLGAGAGTGGGASGPHNIMNSIAYGNGIFCIGAHNDPQYSPYTFSSGVYIYSSVTGNSNSWSFTIVDSNIFVHLNKVQFLKDRFYGFGDNSTLYSSFDGTDWANVTLTTFLHQPDSAVVVSNRWGYNQLYNGFYDGSKIWLIGDNYDSASGVVSPGALYTSTDGITWQQSSSLSSTRGRYAFNTLKFVNGSFFLLGSSVPDYAGVVLGSGDGSNWGDGTPYVPFRTYWYTDVVYDGTRYYLMGEKRDSLYNDLGFFAAAQQTTAPYNYDTGTIQPPYDKGAGLTAIGHFTYSHGHFVASAYSPGIVNENYFLYSSDGLNWYVEDAHLTDYYATAVVPNGDDFYFLGDYGARYILSFGGGALPVGLLNFNAVAAGATSVLTWQTAGEQNSSGFVVGHSLDASHWDSIGWVAAAGQSVALLDYRFVHSDPPKGYNYYRLKAVDLDGRQTYSPVRGVWIGGAGGMRVYPNPVKGIATIQLEEAGAGSLMLFNGAGQLVLQQEFSGNSVRLTLSGMAAGIYQLVVRQNGKRYPQEIFCR
jgi:hypothetical protein